MASSAQMIIGMRRERPDPKALLESLMANGQRFLTTQLVTCAEPPADRAAHPADARLRRALL